MARHRTSSRRPSPPPPAAAGGPEAAAPSPFPPPALWTRPRDPYLVPLALLVLARALAWWSLPLASEDAYITFRFARNLAAGNGLLYNPGEKVMGFSSPLWALWNALGIALIHDPVPWSRATGVLADAVALVVLTRILDRYASRASAWCFALFFALWPYFSVVAVSGMENSLMLALLALGAALAPRGAAATGPVLAALALTRPEGVASAALLALWARGRDRLIALALFAAGVGALWAYYGTPIPQSVLAKSQLYGTPGPWAGRLWWDWIVPFRMGGWPTVGDINMLMPIVVVMAAGAVAALPALWRGRRTGLAAAVAAMAVVWLGYAALGVAYFYWYFLIPLAATALLAAAGLPRIARGRAIYVSAVLYVLGAWTIARILYVGRAQNEAYDFDRVAEFLAASARPGQSVMLEPIGLVGYRTPLRVIDEVGLVTPAVARRRLEGAGWYSDVVRDRRPDWLVVRRGVLARGLAFAGAGAPFRDVGERDSLLVHYAVTDSGNPTAGEQALVILRRSR